MLKISDFAALSLDVYKNKIEIEKYLANYVKGSINLPVNPKEILNRDDGIYEVIIDPVIQDTVEDAFYASLYLVIQQQRVISAVVAIRGSDDLANVAQDIITWGNYVLGIKKKLENMPHYSNPALIFLKQVNNFCQNQLNLSVFQTYVTGHSLGGAIAALLKAKFAMPNPVVTFNAPGIRSMPGVNANTTGIINIRARYDFISIIDYPIGPCWNIDVTQDEAKAKKVFILYEKNKTAVDDSFFQKLKNELVLTDDAIAAAREQHSIINLYISIKIQGHLSVGLAIPA